MNPDMRALPAALGDTYRAHSASCIAIALRILSDGDLAQDAVHAVFLKLPYRVPELPASSQRKYLVSAVRNESLSMLARIRLEQRVSEHLSAAVVFEAPSPLQRIVSRERRAILEGMIRRLPSRCRYVMRLLHGRGLTHSEAARIMGVSTKAIEKQVTRAYRLFRSMPEARLLR